MWDSCKVGAIMGQRRRNRLGFSPISSQLHQVSGLQVPLPFTVSGYWRRDGEREHGGTIISSSSPRQPLRSCCKSQQSPELLQNPSLHPSPPIQEALEHPTIRRCRSVSHCPHKLITLAGLHVELNSWRTVPPCHHLPVPCHAPGCTGWLCSFPS